MSDARHRPVGLIGLGAMGLPIAGFLARAGHPTFCYDPDPAALDRAVAAGARRTESVVDLARRCAVVLVLVPSDQDVLDVCSARDGVLAAAAPDDVLVICSSVLPRTCRTVAERARSSGVRVLDAALTGGVRAAEAGEITLLVGGAAATLEAIRPSLAPWTGTVHHLGPVGAGQVGKTVNNLCHWAQVSAVVEALRLGRALGVPPAALRAAVLDGPAASRTLAELELMRLTWHRKDLANALHLAAGAGQSTPVAEAVRAAMEHVTVAEIAELFR
jgi:3-hydroxyisobutyrate dehydrogenase-like beta-hydroxyacid dehydrogenase